jgi:hypothetical protein
MIGIHLTMKYALLEYQSHSVNRHEYLQYANNRQARHELVLMKERQGNNIQHTNPCTSNHGATATNIWVYGDKFVKSFIFITPHYNRQINSVAK